MGESLMTHIAQRYGVPAEIEQFLVSGFLELLGEQPDRMTVEFHIPSRVSVAHRRRITAYRIVWRHPAHNAEFCDYYHEAPGDLPNFYVEIRNSEDPRAVIDGSETLEHLSAWLEEFQSTSASA
jgi:hypothetical protein